MAVASKNNPKYWDSQLFALEYELKSVSKSFPMTNDRIKQLGEAIMKVDSSVGYNFQREMKNEDSVPDLTKWGQVVAFMKDKPVSVSPIWNILLGGCGEKDRERLQNAYKVHNTREKEKLASTNIIEDMEKMVEQVKHILEQNPSAKGYASDLVPHLKKMYQLDCTFRRSHEQFENAVESLRSENNKKNQKHERDMEKIQQQLRVQTDRYNEVLRLLQEQSSKKDKQEETRKSEKEDTQKKVLRQMVKDLKDELANLRIERSEEISRMVNLELKKVSDEMVHLKGQNEKILQLLQNRS